MEKAWHYRAKPLAIHILTMSNCISNGGTLSQTFEWKLRGFNLRQHLPIDGRRYTFRKTLPRQPTFLSVAEVFNLP